MEVFRVEKTDKYTVISNEHIFDPELSNKAKGLMTILLALPDSWDFNIAGFTKLSKDGRDAIIAQLKELEQAGYITKKRMRNEKGQVGLMEYIVYENKNLNPNFTDCKNDNRKSTKSKVRKSPVDSVEKSSKENITNSNISNDHKIELNDDISNNGLNTEVLPKSDFPTQAKNISKTPKSDFPTQVKNISKTPKSDFPIQGNPIQEKPYTENPQQLNTNKSNTNKSNTNLSIYQMKDDGDKSVLNCQCVAEQISYDLVIQQLEFQEKHPDEPKIISCSKEFYETVYELMCEIMNSTHKSIKIEGAEIPISKVQNEIMKNDEDTICYIYSCIMNREATKPIKNFKAYLLTSLYNAPKVMKFQIEYEISQMFG